MIHHRFVLFCINLFQGSLGSLYAPEECYARGGSTAKCLFESPLPHTQKKNQQEGFPPSKLITPQPSPLKKHGTTQFFIEENSSAVGKCMILVAQKSQGHQENCCPRAWNLHPFHLFQHLNHGRRVRTTDPSTKDGVFRS